MKIQFLNGGLANQTFQYIFARYYELSHPGQIMYLDDSYFALNTVHNGYELEKVYTGVKPHMLSGCFEPDVWQYMLEEKKAGKSIAQIFKDNGLETCMIAESESYQEFNPFSGKVWQIPVNEYHPEVLEFAETEHVYYHGYWLNSGYFQMFQKIFLEELKFPALTGERNRTYEKEILTTNSLSIHIRRGDYVSCGLEQPIDNIIGNVRLFLEHLGAEWHLFVFSDDIPWCRQQEQVLGFTKFASVTYVEGNVRGKNYIDMQLMSQCKAMILSNSSFCYLAALLNTKKKYFINPTKWSVESTMVSL